MKVGVEKAEDAIKFIDVTKTNVAFSNFYLNVQSWKPNAPLGYTFLMASVYGANYATSQNGDYPTIEGGGNNIYGIKDKTYTSITIRYIYYKTS